MHWTASLANRSIPGDAVLADEWTCIGCGYNLRGARLGGQCPECGVQVEQSIAVLAQPEQVAAGLRTVALSFLSDLAILLWAIKLMFGASSALFFGFLFLGAGRAFRLFAAWQLRHQSSLQRHGVLHPPLTLFFACVVCDAVLLLGSFGYQFFELTAGANAFSTQVIAMLTVLWLIAAFVTHAWAGLLGLRLSQLLDYAILPREFKIQLAWVVATCLLAVLVAVTMVLGSPRGFLIVGAVGLLAALIMLGYSIVATMHLANAADKQRHSLHDLLELETT